MDEGDCSAGSGKPQGLIRKEPVNESTTFFTDELYRQLAGPEPTLEERAMQMMDALGYGPPRSSPHGCVSTHRQRGRPAGASDVERNSFTGDRPESLKAKKDNEAVISSDSTSSKQQISESFITQEKNEAVISSDSRSLGEQMPSTHVKTDSLENTKINSALEPELAGPKNKEMSACESETVQGGKHSSFVTSRQEQLVTSGAVSGICNADGNGSQKDGELDADVGGKSLVSEFSEQIASAARAYQGNCFKAKRPPVPESGKSSLKHKEHVRYLELFKKCTKRFFTGFVQPPSEEELQELREFEKLQVMVAKEQEECQTYLKKLALHNSSLYANLPPHVMKYMQEKEESNWRRADSYARYYNQHIQLPLTVASLSVSVPPALMLVQTLVQLGSKCRLHMPDLNPIPEAKSRRTVPMEIQKVTARFPPVRLSKHVHSGPTWNHEPASKDGNMETLVHKYQCHIATSVSVIQELLDNHPPDFSTAWDIPVIIKEYGDGSASKRVVYLDKPLLPKGLSQCQQKTHYLQKAVQAYLCQPHNTRVAAGGNAWTTGHKGQGVKQVKAAPEKKDSSGKPFADRKLSGGAGVDDDDPFGASVSMEDLETFGSDRLFSQSSWKVPDWKPQTFNTSAKTAGVKKEEEVNQMECATGKEAPNSAGDDQNMGYSGTETVTKPDERDSNKNTEPVPETNVCAEAKLKEEPTKNADSCSDTSLQLTSQHKSSETYSTASSGALDHDASSDSEDDGLVIAEPEGLESSPCGPVGPLRRRSSRSSKSSIFDEIPTLSMEASNNTGEKNVSGELTPRRMTRSAAHKLQSPEGPTTLHSDVTSPRTRHGSKRKPQDIPQTQEAADITSSSQNPLLSRSEDGKTDGSLTEMTSSAKKAKQTVDETHAAGVTNTSAVGGTKTQSGKSDDIFRRTGGLGLSQSAMETQTGRNVTDRQGMKRPPPVGAATPLDSILKEMTPTGGSTQLKFQAEDPSQYRQPECTGDHVSYHLWNLSGVSVMVRSNNHAFIRDMRQQQKVVYVRAKAERQVHYGLEQITLSECIRAWLGCYLRPNSYLLRARVNMQTQEVVHIEELQLDQILQPSLNFSPPYAFAVLQNIFSKLMELPAGSYLLSHEPGADHIQLKAGTGTKRGGFDLRCLYMGLGVMKETDKTIPWVPIDPTIMLPHHWRMGLIPATFQPPDFENKNKQQRHFSGPKRKNKNKNRRKKQK
ncbi:little elongation complex subunit 2-like isoform X2 [Littorina saxatilis]|uniref:Little elongation complex subunit 2 C-terminal domain-containing protein n=1 Tax=Littorina saxatilis TaxID=31220 RepID=A0AAN9GHU4_9CAEN